MQMYSYVPPYASSKHHISILSIFIDAKSKGFK